MHLIGARIPLFQRDAIVKRVDGDILVQMLAPFVHKGDDGGVKFVLNGKHGSSLRDHTPKASASYGRGGLRRIYRGDQRGHMQQFTGFLTDRGSKYAVSGGPVASREEVKAFLKTLTRDKRFAKASHNTWAAIIPEDGPSKGDDGEAGAGLVILRMLEREGLQGHIIVVTRWFGGTKLGGDRFRRVQDCVDHYFAHADLAAHGLSTKAK